MNDDGFLTTEGVLEYLQVNLRTVYRLVQARKIPAVRVGRQWRFRKRDIDAWLDSQRAHQDRPSPAPRPAAAGRAARPRILLVDEQAPSRAALAQALALADYVVDEACDGLAAVDRLRVISYDLLVTELRVPGLDGMLIIREARRLRPDLPVLIVTAHSTEASAIDALNLGVCGYLLKPVRLPRLMAAVSKAIGEDDGLQPAPRQW